MDEPTVVETTHTPGKTNASWGAVIGVILVLALLIVGAFYFWGKRVSESTMNTEAIEALEMQSDSTEAEAIEADLAAESPDEFDAELDAAFAELEASLAE